MEVIDATKKTYTAPMTRGELADMLRVSIATITREMEAGNLKYSFIGKGSVRFFSHQIDAYLKQCEVIVEEEKTQMAANL